MTVQQHCEYKARVPDSELAPTLKVSTGSQQWALPGLLGLWRGLGVRNWIG